MLQFGNCIRCPHMVFTTDTESVFTTGIQRVRQHRIIAVSEFVQAQCFVCYFKQADTFNIRCRTTEVFIDQRAVQADCFKNLRTTVRHVCRNTHFRHHLHQAFTDCLGVVINYFLRIRITRQFGCHGSQCFHHQIRMHRFRTVTCEQCEVVGFTCRAGFHDQTGSGTQTTADQMLMHRGSCQQRRNRDMIFISIAISDDHDVMAGFHRIHHLRADRRQTRFNTLFTPRHRIADIQFIGFEFTAGIRADITQSGDIREIEHRLCHFQTHRRIDVIRIQQIRFRADERDQRHHHRFANRINRRISDLRKQLLEVVIQRLQLVRHDCQRSIIPHRTDGFFTAGCHRCQHKFHIFLGVAERLLTIQ